MVVGKHGVTTDMYFNRDSWKNGSLVNLIVTSNVLGDLLYIMRNSYTKEMTP